MEEVSDTPFGMRINAIERTHKAARNGVLFGILNVKPTSTMLLAAFVLQTAHMALLILESHAKKTLMVEVLEKF